MNSALSFTLSCLLHNTANLSQIRQVHAQIILNGLSLFLHHQLLKKLIDLNNVDYARPVFNQIPTPNEFCWNSMIRCYNLNNSPQNSLFLYLQMLRNGVEPSNFTYPFVLKACSILGLIQVGEQVHTHVYKLGFRSDVYVNNCLVHMYCKSCCLGYAQNVWDEMLIRDEVSWNSIISGYVQCGELERARHLFEEMPIRQQNVVCWTALINGYGKEGNLGEMLRLFRKMVVSGEDIEPNSATMVCLLSSCSSLSNFEVGRWVSVFVEINAIPVNAILCTALIDLYAKCGNVDKAQQLFDKFSCKNLASWNALMTGYVHGGCLEEVVNLYRRMQVELVKPDEITMVNVLSACAGLGALELGREVHLYLGRNCLEQNVVVATALVEMYSKCGNLDDACLVFVKTRHKDLALWNAMILGLACNGNGRDALSVLRQMESAGFQPNEITFIGLLSACSQAGLVEEGRKQFSGMNSKHGLSPKVEHYACMVDLLGRAGHLEEAYELIQNMVVPPDAIIWGALLSACRIHKNLELANKVGEIIMTLPNLNLGFCILLSNIYASAGRWRDVAKVRRFVKSQRIKKPSGCSWIEVEGVVHRFVVEDKSHLPQEKYSIHLNLIDHLKDEGYVPILDVFQNNIDGM